jgi:hypothetical protein
MGLHFDNLTYELLYEEFVTNKLSLFDIHKKYGIELRSLTKKMRKFNIIDGIICNRCGTSQNLKTDKNGAVYSICYDCYHKTRVSMWESLSDEDKNNINKKVGDGVKRAFKNDLSILIRKTNTLKTTWDNTSQEEKDAIIEKRNNTTMEKYGCTNVFQAPQIISKIKETKLLKYGDENYRNIDKALKTKEERYGDSHYNNKEQNQKTYFEKTGYYSPSQNPEIVEKRRLSYFEKTGYYNQFQNPEVIEKIRDTCLERYGVPNPIHLYRKVSKISQELFWRIYDMLPEDLKQSCYFDSLNKEFGAQDINNNIYYFYDFVITSKKICIEFNGDYWHANPKFYESTEIVQNTLVADIWKKDKAKMKFVESLGFIPITIWENDYLTNKQKIINDIIERILC